MSRILIWEWRTIIVTTTVCAAVFVVGLCAGFLLKYESVPDEQQIVIDRAPLPSGPESFIGGEIVSIDSGRLLLRTTNGLTEFNFSGQETIEELQRTTELRFRLGDTVNLGGEQGDFGLVLTGVVAVEAP